MPRITEYQWYGYYDDFKQPFWKSIPQFGELWQVPDHIPFNIHGYTDRRAVFLPNGTIVIGTGRYKFDKRYSGSPRIKVMTTGGLFLWLSGGDAGLLEKVADCPE